MSPDHPIWTALAEKLDPVAWHDLCNEVEAGETAYRQPDILARAIELHARYTGVTLTFHF